MRVLVANAQAEEVQQTSVSLRRYHPASRIEAVFSAEEMLAWAAKEEWQAIIVDAGLLGPSPADVLLELKRRAGQAVLIHVDPRETLTGEQAVRSGADLILSKRSPSFLAELPILLDTLLHSRRLTTQLEATQAHVQQITVHLAQVLTAHSLLEEELRLAHAQLEEQDRRLRDRRAPELPPEEVQRLRDALVHAQAQAQRLEQQLPEIKAQRQRALDDLAHLRQDTGQQQEHLHRLEERLRQQEAEQQALLQEHQALQRTARDTEARLHHLERQRRDGVESHQPVLDQLDKVKRELARVQEAYAYLQERAGQAERGMAAAVEQRDQLQQVYGEVRDRLQQRDSQLRDAVAQREAALEQLAALRRDYAAAQARLAQRAGESGAEPPADR